MNRIEQKIFRPHRREIILGAALVVMAMLFAGCGKKAASPPPPPEVGVVTVATEPLPVTTELPGRMDAVRTAQVRARVAGILLKENYVEGSDVKAGRGEPETNAGAGGSLSNAGENSRGEPAGF
jgi:multidrug efflux pump subunit AcrA (membrane-fusion protein)